MKDYLKKTDFVLNTCESEYARDSQIKKDDIRQILDWVEKQPHMPKVTECMLIQFYQASDYSLQKAKNLVESYYSFKNEVPEAFNGLDYDRSLYKHSFWDVIYCLQLPKLTSKGYRVIYCGFRDTDSSKFNVEMTLRMYQKTVLTGVMANGTCEGYAFIYDPRGLSLGHFATLTLSLARKYLYYVQELEPFHIREVHIVNVHSLMDKLMMLLKPFMKKELYDMIQMHSNANDLFKYIDKDTIPLDIEGELPYTRDEIQKMTRAQVDMLAPFVEAELELRTDETKRSKSKDNEKSSISASFKQLIID